MASSPTIDGRMAERRHELFADMMALVTRLLTDNGVAANEALLIASDLADRLADHWGGQNITFPKEYRRKLSRLEAEIYQAHCGDNGAALAQRYGITERGLSKMMARVRKRIRAGNQPGLFDAATPGS